MVDFESRNGIDKKMLSRRGLAPVIVVGVVVLILAILAIGYWVANKYRSPGTVACTEEAKLCPDGSSVGRTGPNCEFAACPPVASFTAVAIETSDWKTYTNQQYGFSFKYPLGWQVSTNGLQNTLGSTSSSPFIELRAPSTATTSYLLIVSILDNPEQLLSKDFVQELLARDEAQDSLADQNQEPSENTPKFDKQYAVPVGSYDGYELYNVFEYDQDGEQIYVAHGNEVLKFDFPTADPTNLNLSSPVENNATVYAILSTVQLVQPRSDVAVYANQAYGVTFEYPRTWRLNAVDPAGGAIEFDSLPQSAYTEGGVLPNGGADVVVYRTMDALQNVMSDDLSGSNATGSSVTVGGVNGLRASLSADSNGIATTLVYLSHGGYTYKIILGDRNDLQAVGAFDHLLSSFQFFQPTVSASTTQGCPCWDNVHNECVPPYICG
jgi:hypothetical protein